MAHFKKILNILLLVSFVITILVPLTGIHMHKLASTLFLMFSVIHTVTYRNKLGTKKYLLLGVAVLAFISGVLGMIFDHFAIILTLHKVISIISVFFLGIHIFVYHKSLFKKKVEQIRYDQK